MTGVDVSVVIPSFNRPQLLRETVESVLAQTCPAREVIVVDNGFGDETAQMLLAYQSCIRHIRTKPAGVQAARNVGLQAASSRWVATLDDDDLWHPTYLEHAAPALTDGRATLVFGDHRKFIRSPESGRVSRQTNAERAPAGYWDGIQGPGSGADWTFVGRFPVERLLRYNVFYPSTMIIRRDLFDQVGGYDPAVRGIKTEDLEMMTRVLPVADLAFAWRALVDYRLHGSNHGGDLPAQSIGRWRIFEYVAEKGEHGSPALRDALAADLPARRRAVVRAAFRQGEFDVLSQVVGRMGPGERSVQTRLLTMLARLPRPLLDQMVRIAVRLRSRPHRERTQQPHWTSAIAGIPRPGTGDGELDAAHRHER